MKKSIEGLSSELNTTFAKLLVAEDATIIDQHIVELRQDLLELEKNNTLPGGLALLFIEMFQFRLLRDDAIWKKLPFLATKTQALLRSKWEYKNQFRAEVKSFNLGPLLGFIE